MKSKSVTSTKVILVSQKGDSALVEYIQDGLTIRKYIPASKLNDDRVNDDVLQQGIPYGYPWDEMQITFDGQKFSREMHKVGLWTVEDVLKNPNKLWSALRATLADNLNEILTISSQEKKRSKDHG